MELVQTSYTCLSTEDLVNHVLAQGGTHGGFTELEVEMAQRLLMATLLEGADGSDT